MGWSGSMLVSDGWLDFQWMIRELKLSNQWPSWSQALRPVRDCGVWRLELAKSKDQTPCPGLGMGTADHTV
jgi:hypothetical protein